MSEGVDLGVDVEVDGGFVWSGKGDALQDVFGDNGVVEVGSVAAVGWCRSVWVEIVVLVVKDVVGYRSSKNDRMQYKVYVHYIYKTIYNVISSFHKNCI